MKQKPSLQSGTTHVVMLNRNVKALRLILWLLKQKSFNFKSGIEEKTAFKKKALYAGSFTSFIILFLD